MTSIKTAALTPAMRQCARECLDAAMAFTEWEAACLETDGARADAAILAMVKDCAEMCRLTAESTLRGSACRGMIAHAAALACTRCAEDCVRSGGDRSLQRCADGCVWAAAACRRIASA
jgi:hypothetical protein